MIRDAGYSFILYYVSCFLSVHIRVNPWLIPIPNSKSESCQTNVVQQGKEVRQERSLYSMIEP
jgi:hypothetical protein